jgi:hypothetical protein
MVDIWQLFKLNDPGLTSKSQLSSRCSTLFALNLTFPSRQTQPRFPRRPATAQYLTAAHHFQAPFSLVVEVGLLADHG